MKIKKHLLWVFLLWQVHVLLAQSHNYDLISMADGLPSNTVYDVLTDQKGYVWFATDRGVARYDGHNMKIFTTANGLASNDVWSLWEDSQGRIWLYSFTKEVSFIEGDTVRLAWVKERPVTLSAFYEQDRVIYSVGYRKLFGYKNGDVQVTDLGDDLNETSFCAMPGQRVLFWDGSDSLLQISSYLSQKKEGLRYFSFAEAPMLDLSYGKYVMDSTFIFGFVGDNLSTIYRWNWQTNESIQFDLYGLLDGPFAKLSMVNDKLLASFSSGFVLLDKNLKEVDRFFLPAENKKIYGDYVSVGQDGTVFHIVKGEGVFVLPVKKKNAIHFDISGVGKGVSALNLIDGELLVGCKDGSVYELVDSQLVVRIDSVVENSNKVINMSAVNEQIWLGRQSNISIFTKDFFPAKVDIDGLEYTYNSHFRNYLNGYRDSDIKVNERDYLSVLGSLKSLYYHDKLGWLSFATGADAVVLKMTNPKVMRVGSYNLTRQYATVITDDSLVWYGGTTGLSYIKEDSVYRLSNGYSLYTKSVTSLVLDQSQNLWVGTDGFGVYRYQQNGVPIFVTGCEYDIILDMKIAPNGDLWMSTNHGVKQVTIDERQPGFAQVKKVYTPLDGLSTDACAKIYVTDSLLYAGSDLGVDVLPIAYAKGDMSPRLYVNNISVNGRERTPDKNWRFAYDENDLSISFTGISLASKKALTYRYFVNNYTNDTLGTHENVIHLSHLPHGSYDFRIFAEDFDGNRSGVKTVRFSIAKPWYSTWWAYLLVIGLIGLFAYLLVLRRIKKIEKRASVKKRMAELELQALQSQLNPHFIFNALGAIQQYKYGKKADDAEEYFSGFARLMRLYLESSKQATMPLKDELELIKLYVGLEKLRFEDKFDVEILVDKDMEIDHINIPSMVLQPFVENAINHGLFHKMGKGHLLIHVMNKDEDWIYVVVRDDGIGREKSKEIAEKTYKRHQSRAMQIIEERLKIMNQIDESDITINILDLYDDAGESAGTEVQIVLPLLS